MKKLLSILLALTMTIGFTVVSNVSAETQVVKDFYSNTDFEQGNMDDWVIRNDSVYLTSNIEEITENGNSYLSLSQTAASGWMLTKTLAAPMTDKVVFEADIDNGSTTNKVGRNYFFVSQKGATGQIALLKTSYSYFQSADSEKLYPLGANDMVHVKVEFDFSTGEIAYYFNYGEKVTNDVTTGKAINGTVVNSAFKTTYAYDTIKMHGVNGAVLSTKLDNISIYKEKIKEIVPVEPETPKEYYVNTDFDGEGDNAWGGWTLRNTTAQPASNGTIKSENGNQYASFVTGNASESNGWFMSIDSPRDFTGEVTFETRIKYTGVLIETDYNRSLFTISANGDDGQVALINNNKSQFFKTACNIGGAASTQQLLKKMVDEQWVVLKVVVNFDTGAVEYYMDDSKLTVDGNSGAELKTNLSEMASSFTNDKSYHMVKLYMANTTLNTTTDIDYIKIYKNAAPCKGNIYKVSVGEEGSRTYKRLYNLEPGIIEGRIVLNNDSETPKKETVLMALYKNGEIVDISIQNSAELAPGEVKEEKCEVQLNIAEGESISQYSAKLFVWDELNSIIPLYDAIEFVPDCSNEI